MKTTKTRNRNLPTALTSHDLLKSLALLLMIVDHVGYFFFPEEQWFRVIGRLSVPIWFYLIGFADTRLVQSAIWLGGGIVILSTILAGEFILPFNILLMLGIGRLWIDRIMAGALQSYEAFAGMFFLLFFLSLPSMILFEYGTMGLMFTVLGYLRRHKEGITIKPIALFGFIAAISLFYSVVSGILIPELNASQALFLFGGVFALSAVLFFFRSYEFTEVSKKCGTLIVPFKIMGRHTLLVYVLHLVVLRAIMLAIGDERFGFLQAEIMPPTLIQIVRSFLG